jgi:hypothetical protein
MQQFARRPEPEGAPEPVVSNDTLAQLLDQISALARDVAGLREELAQLKSSPHGQAQVEEAPVELETAFPAVAERPKAATDDLSVDEESLVELVRTSPVNEAAAQPAPLTDDEIQRMLTEAALGAMDASSESAVREETAEPVEEEPVTLVLDEQPPTTSGAISFDASVVARVPSALAIAALAVPHRLEGGTMFVKAVEPFDKGALDVIADAVACTVVPEPAPMEDVLAALRSAYSQESRELERDAAWTVTERPKKRRGLFRRAA